MPATADILRQAAQGLFHHAGDWLAAHPSEINAADDKGWTVLHHAAAAEAAGKDVEDAVRLLLETGADPHQPDLKGETPFNLAAANSPVTGRLMTSHWLEQALEGKGPKKINDRSGSHGSTLAQYMAKWSRDEEIEAQLRQAVEAGMKVDVLNKSGWTPLSAAAAMGRTVAVRAFIWHYTHAAVHAKTTEAYSTAYNGQAVTYPAGITAAEIAYARLAQDKGASPTLQNNLSACIGIIINKT
jgi:ankyrin repeat protein